MFPYLRTIVCILFVTIWTIWLISLPSANNQKTENKKIKTLEKPSVTEQKIEDKKQSIERRKQNPHLKPRTSWLLNMNTQAHQHTLNELPKLVNLIPKKEKEIEKQRNKDEEIQKSSHIAVINFPYIAQATRKALLSNNLPSSNPTTIPEISLRKKIQIKNKQETNLEMDWLPKYVIASKQLTTKAESATNNLDKIVNQLELVGLIQNPDGKGAAIIRNKTNNKIEILKPGEEYQELKLLEIKNTEIILGNLNLNKTYTKKIIVR